MGFLDCSTKCKSQRFPVSEISCRYGQAVAGSQAPARTRSAYSEHPRE